LWLLTRSGVDRRSVLRDAITQVIALAAIVDHRGLLPLQHLSEALTVSHGKTILCRFNLGEAA
jgi:hypothetical protein